MKIVIEFPSKVFYSSEKSGNPAIKSQKTIKKIKKKKTTLHNLLRLFTVLYFFVRSLRYTASYRHRYLDFQITEGSGVGDYSSGGEGGQINRGTVMTSLQLAFTERVVPATQAFDWSLDNRY